MKSSSGERLKFFLPFSFPESSDVNVFSQNLAIDENYYVFPPFILIGPLLRFFKTFGSITMIIIALDVSPRRFWWPLLESMSIGKIKIGSRAQEGIVVCPLHHPKVGIHVLCLGISTPLGS